MTKAQIRKKIAILEFIQDQMETELVYADGLLRSVGFPNGLDSVKQVALELLDETEEKSHQENENFQ